MAAAYFGVLLLPSLSPHYGFYSDELYYLACTDRLALGYVDQPPFFVWVLRLHREIFGSSLIGLRVLPAASGALAVFLTGWMAGRMGGGRFAQVLGSLAMMASINSLTIFSFFTVNCLAILLWTLASWVLLELCRSREPRLWIVLGVILGIAVLNKHSALVPIAGVVVATLLSPLRRDLSTWWPWLGALCLGGIVLPNLYWQLANDWPSLEFYMGLSGGRYRANPLEQVVGQIVFQNPASAPIWIAGIVYFLRSTRGTRYRPLGWFFVTALVLGIVGGSKLPYRIAGAFPVVFAGGAVLIEAVRKPDTGALRRVWNTYTLPFFMILIAGAAATIVLPILPPPVLEKNPLYDANEGSGWRPEVGTNRIPYHLGNRTHWKGYVAEVAEVYRSLEPHERESAVILTDYFGHAGAIEYYGGEYGLPPVYSSMTGYHTWGPPPDSADPVISTGIDPEFLHANFESVEVAATFNCGPYCPPVVSNLPIYVLRSPTRPWAELWPEIGRLDDRRTRLSRP